MYSIPFLRPGQCNLTVTQSGFKTAVRSNITLNVSQVAGVDVALEVGQLTDSVTVEANAAMLETQTASRSGVIDNKTIADLPLNARNPFMLGATQSGVTFRGAAIWQRPFDNGAIAEWSINGGQQSRNEFLLDGAPNNAQLGGNNIALVPVVDSVQEFTIQTNSYDAAYGRTGGGVINVVLKSGGAKHHGAAWEFLRRAPLNANSFQNNARGRTNGIENVARPNGSMDQYGIQMDGPIYVPKLLKKDAAVKLFYMGTYEGYCEGTPNPLRNSFAQPEMRTGDFSRLTQPNGQAIRIYDPLNASLDATGNPVRLQFPNNQIPASRIDPVARRVTAFMPAPNNIEPGQRYSTTNFILPTYVNQDDFHNLGLKFDWNFGDKHRTFNPSNNNLRSLGFETNTPIVASLDDGRTPINGVLSNPFPNGFARPAGAGLGANTFVGRDFNHWTTEFKLPAIDQFSLGFQYQVNSRSVLDMSYIGSFTRNHETQIERNIPSANFMKQCDALQGGLPNFCNEQLTNPFRGNTAFTGTPFFTANTLSRYQLNRPFPQFNGNLLQQGLNDGQINYHSMQINYNVRMSGLTILANYTYSRMLEQFGFIDPFNRVEQRSLYFNDRPHVMKLTTSYDLPFGKGKKFGGGVSNLADKFVGGWQVTSFFQWATGEPADYPGNVLPLRDSTVKDIQWNSHQVKGFGNCVVRQNNDGTRTPMPYSVTAGCGTDLSKYDFLWVGDFSPGQTAPGRQTPLRMPNLRKHRVPTLDASLLKTTRFGERMRAQFGFEAFNAINKYYFGRNDSFNTNPNDPNFGTLFPSLTSNQNFRSA